MWHHKPASTLNLCQIGEPGTCEQLCLTLAKVMALPAEAAELVLKVVATLSGLYVTGYWKTDHNVTLGQWHFIGPANSHTHALSMHCCITGLS